MSTPLKNRAEVITLINSLTAVHTESAYKDTLGDQIADNLVFRKKVTGTQAGAGSINVDFSGKDYMELTLSGNSTITFLNIEQGEEKVLKIVKTAGHSVSFSSALDQTPDTDNVTALSSIYYLVFKKDTAANIIVQPLSKTFGAASESAKGIAEIATQAEVENGTDDTRIVTPKKLADKAADAKINWVNATNTYTSVQNTTCRACKVDSIIYVSIDLDYNTLPGTGEVIFTLPVSFPFFTEDVNITIAGQASEVNQLKAKDGTRQIVAGVYSSPGATAGSAAIPVI